MESQEVISQPTNEAANQRTKEATSPDSKMTTTNWRNENVFEIFTLR